MHGKSVGPGDPLGEVRRRLATQVLRQTSSGMMPEGGYQPVGNVRYFIPGDDHTSSEARMVSWHEAFHAFLNASTTFGSTMIIMGLLANAGKPGFESLVHRMMGLAVETHESYATVAALRAVSRDTINPSGLDGYPDYQRYLSRFLALFDPARPTISTIALSSCARVAMQTNIYSELLAQPCSEWPSLQIPQEMQPDIRFEAIMTRTAVAAALAAINQALATGGGVLAPLAGPGMTPAEEADMFARASPGEQEVINVAAFDAFAEALARQGFGQARYGQQKDDLEEIIRRVQQFAGTKLDTEFHVPTSDQEENEAIFRDFRRELLFTADVPVRASFFDGQLEDRAVEAGFVHSSESGSYLQLVAMPADKASYLYDPVSRSGPADERKGGVVSGFRRRASTTGAVGVELLITDRTAAERVIRDHPACDILMIVSLTAIADAEWRAEWLMPAAPVAQFMVVIDDDPIDLVRELAANGEVRLAAGTAVVGAGEDGGRVEILVVLAEWEPNILYFTPISAPNRQSVVEVALNRVAGATLDPTIISLWLPFLARAVPHLLREESAFGTRFW